MRVQGALQLQLLFVQPYHGPPTQVGQEQEQHNYALITPIPATITRDSVTHTPHITIRFHNISASYTRQYVFFRTHA